MHSGPECCIVCQMNLGHKRVLGICCVCVGGGGGGGALFFFRQKGIVYH